MDSHHGRLLADRAAAPFRGCLASVSLRAGNQQASRGMKDRIRRGCVMVVLGWLALPAVAQQPAQVQVRVPVTVKPPDALAAYFAQVRQAEQIADPEKRCLAYPDLPGNQWPAGAAEWRAGSAAMARNASLASSTSAALNRPAPIGRWSPKPVSCCTTGRPDARYAALRSLNQPLRVVTYALLHTLNSAHESLI